MRSRSVRRIAFRQMVVPIKMGDVRKGDVARRFNLDHKLELLWNL